MTSHRADASPVPNGATKSVWIVSIYSVATDALLAERQTTGIDESAVRTLWQLSADDPPRPLLVTADKLEFVNEHLAEPVELRKGEEIYLEEYAE